MTRKIALFLGMLFFFTGVISEPGRCPEIETTPASRPQIKIKALAKPKLKFVMVEATAYAPPLFPEGALTFSGEPVGWGIVAVDPEVIPLGSRLKFVGLFEGKVFFARDTGREIKGRRVDIWFPAHGDALNWGSRQVVVVVEGRG